MAVKVDFEFNRRWREDWLSSIREIADIEQQREKWLDPENSNPHYSFIEYVCCYFDDLGIADGYSDVLDQGLVNPLEVAAVAQLHELLGRYQPPQDYGDDDENDAKILSDPYWTDVVLAAKAAQGTLSQMLKDHREIAVVLGKIA